MDDREKDIYEVGDGPIEIEIQEEPVNHTEQEGQTYRESNGEGSDTIRTKSSKKRDWSGFKKSIALVLIGALVGGGAIGFGVGAGMRLFQGANFKNTFYLEKSSQAKPVALIEGGRSIVDIAETVGPTVVPITSKTVGRDMFFNEFESEGLGSGVVFNVSKDSVLIMTNNHVVADADEVMVGLTPDSVTKASVVGVDQETDLAVLKILKSDIAPEVLTKVKVAVLGDSDKLRVGEPAIAIGNPLGYSGSVSAGIISALNRTVDTSLNSLSLIQTDAAINPGNSGGALVNSNGEVIGINTIKISNTTVEGIGFAIPINAAKPIIDQLLTQGYVSRPFLGIAGRTVDEQISNIYELPLGVVVINVTPDSSAQAAGIRKGDVIISFDGEKISEMEQLVTLIGKHKVGDKVVVKLVRGGTEKLEVTVTLRDKNAR